MLIQATTGAQNFPTGSTKLHVFFVPTRLRMGQELHIGQMAKGMNPDVPVTSANVQRFPAMNGAPETLGTWTQAQYNIPEGVVLKVFGSKRISTQGQALPTRTACIYVQVRSGAPLTSIGFNLIEHDRSPVSRAEMQGRFDILTMAELAQLGVTMRADIMGQISDVAVNRIFNLSILERQTQARHEVKTSTLKNSEGETVAIQRSVVRRAVKL